jgi:aminopeptidase-like protein
MQKYFDRLFLLNRSITGKDYRKSLEIISELVPLDYIDVPSGTLCHNWIVPYEWNCAGAWIITPTGKKICDFSKNNLHVVGYSEPVDEMVTWRLLKKHIHTLPELPDAVPYITSYYKRTWGFCMSHRLFLLLDQQYRDDSLFYVRINAEHKPGFIRMGEALIPGRTEREIMLSTYMCHPSMANNELSGPLVWAMVYQELLEYDLEHTIRFYVGPENIGAVAYLTSYDKNSMSIHTRGTHLIDKLDAGYVINCVGLGPEYTYKESRRGNTLADRAALNVISNTGVFGTNQYNYMKFFPDGSDERQYCSPGYDLPFGVFMRRPYWGYPEYHTSLDYKLDWDTMEESVDTLVDIVLTADRGNEVWTATVQMGTPQFSQCSEDIYASTMKLNSFMRPDFNRKLLLDLCNFCDGKHTLLDIAERRGYKMIEMLAMVERLKELDYIRRKR